jgi:hypothetical protein
MGCLGRLLRSIATADGSKLDAPEASRLCFITFHLTYSKEHAAVLTSSAKSKTLPGVTVKVAFAYLHVIHPVRTLEPPARRPLTCTRPLVGTGKERLAILQILRTE